MLRVATDRLNRWADAPDRRPLVVHGARQVGKTWIVTDVRERRFPGGLITIDLELRRNLHRVFEGDLSAARVLSGLEVAVGRRLLPAGTGLAMQGRQRSTTSRSSVGGRGRSRSRAARRAASGACTSSSESSRTAARASSCRRLRTRSSRSRASCSARCTSPAPWARRPSPGARLTPRRTARRLQGPCGRIAQSVRALL